MVSQALNILEVQEENWKDKSLLSKKEKQERNLKLRLIGRILYI
jgi:hypothetical protein